MSVTQQQIRKSIRARRRSLTPAQRRTAARSIANLICGNRTFKFAQNIALYWPQDGEADLRPLIHRAWVMKKNCYLPVLSSFSNEQLLFALYTHQSKLVANRFNIPEPETSPKRLIKPSSLDVIYTPLVAFDESCNRIGMGGGFYDRTFAFLNRRRHWRRPKLIGVAYELQKISAIQPNAWDVILDAVITERKIYLKKPPATIQRTHF